MANPLVTLYHHAVADMYPSYQRCVGINGYMVANDRVPRDSSDGIPAFIRRKFFSGKADTLEDADIISNDAGLAYHGSCPVVYCEVMPYLGSRVDIYSCLGMSHLGNDSWNIRYIQTIQLMGYPVIHNGSETRIAEDNLAPIPCRRVGIVVGFGIRRKDITHSG